MTATLRHTILGANGVIGRELSAALPAESSVRQVSRNPRAVRANDEVMSANLLDADAVQRAVADSDVAYLLAGLRYDARVWQEEWPRIMRNVIDACARQRVRLVFFDNVYSYGLVEGAMTESTPYRPVSRKGEVRASIATMLLDAMRAGNVQAMIVRAADFYGPGAVGLFNATVVDRIRAGRTPQWVGDPDALHTFTYTPDAGRAVAALALDESAYGTTWHAPTSPERTTGRELLRLACEIAGRPFKLQVAPRWMLRAMGLFMPVLRENEEMMYQFERDYVFDASRIAAEKGLAATPYREGLRATLSP